MSVITIMLLQIQNPIVGMSNRYQIAVIAMSLVRPRMIYTDVTSVTVVIYFLFKFN